MTRDEVNELLGDDEALFADGFDAAILGITSIPGGGATVIVYDHGRCVEVLTENGHSFEDAVDLVNSSASAYVGPLTPLFITRTFD